MIYHGLFLKMMRIQLIFYFFMSQLDGKFTFYNFINVESFILYSPFFNLLQFLFMPFVALLLCLFEDWVDDHRATHNYLTLHLSFKILNKINQKLRNLSFKSHLYFFSSAQRRVWILIQYSKIHMKYILIIRINVMNRHQDESKCRIYLKQAILIMLFLMFIVIFYNTDENILRIGSLNSNITTSQNQDISSAQCVSICFYPYIQPSNSSQCCQDVTVQTTCKQKMQCHSDILANYQDQLHHQYLNLLLNLGIQLFIVIIGAVYCIKKRKERTKRMRETYQRQNNRENIPSLINIANPLQIFQHQNDPALLRQSFLNKEIGHNCSICLQSLQEAKVIELKCCHMFHSECIREWMQSKNTCPICRMKN